jgi:small subunit ribosomal protein S15
MALAQEEKAEIVRSYGDGERDTGKTEVQVALITKRIEDLNRHLQDHKKDHSSRRSLLKLVGQRRRLLRYLQRTDIERYRSVISRLGLRK